MENNDGDIKSQTGGLKLMTVFIAVLALHVVVIGGFTVYHLMTGSTDMDLTTDKNTKKTDSTVAADSTPTDTSRQGASDTAATPSTTVATDVTPAPEVTPAPIPATVPKPAPATTVTTTTSTKITPAAPAPAPAAVTTLTPGVPPSTITSLAPPPEPTLSLASPPPIAPLTTTPLASMPIAGPVHMPSPSATHSGSTRESTADRSADVLSKKETYTVKITDSFKKIAKAHHVSVAQLKETNGLKGDTLHAGQKLIIPATKSSFARSDSSSTSSLAAASVGTSSHHHSYVVRQGDTLSYIAKKFNTTKTAILAANDISNPTKLTPGKKLRIPATREARSAAASTPAYVPTTRVTPVAPAPVAQPAPAQPVASQPYAPQPTVTPELANMTF